MSLAWRVGQRYAFGIRWEVRFMLQSEEAKNIKKLIASFRRLAKEHEANPEAARQWLIRIGILDKSGKRLARRYR
jgi:hypothetical protein